MSKLTDQTYLRQSQYRDAANLKARAHLHQHYSTNPYGWHRWIFDQLCVSEKCRVLELGCGPGYLWQQNEGRIGTRWYIVLSDLSPGMVQEARKNLERWFSKVRMNRYEDALLVKEVDPLVAYINSLTNTDADEDEENKLRDFLTHELATSGAIRITKDSGIFEATRPSDA